MNVLQITKIRPLSLKVGFPFLDRGWRNSMRIQAMQESNQSGRSMIEMLGVLAIIGALSIGGIAGYSKAMYKHKLNKQAEQLNYIFAGILENQDKLKNYTGETYSVITTFKALDIIPSDMKIVNNRYSRDSLNNAWSWQYFNSGGSSYFYVMINNIRDKAFDQCKNFFDIAKAYSSIMWHVQIGRLGTHITGQMFSVYGDNNCRSSLDCLSNISVARIAEICKVCDNIANENSCGFRFLFGGNHW